MFAAGAAAYIFAIMPEPRHRAERMKGNYYAHRGLHDAEHGIPENSMAAFARAVEAGVGIELDVQLTKDEQVVVFHDFDLKRICSADGEVSDYTYEELQKLFICQTAGADRTGVTNFKINIRYLQHSSIHRHDAAPWRASAYHAYRRSCRHTFNGCAAYMHHVGTSSNHGTSCIFVFK